MSSKYETLVFLHIPKTAGSTFHFILNSTYKPDRVRNVFGSRYSEPEIKRFIEEPLADKRSIQLLKGHMPFGLHKHLEQRCKYITVLRDPVERVISQYYYIKKNAHNPLHKQIEGGAMSISDFVSSGIAIGMNNGQLRFLNGDISEYKFNECNEQMFDQVIENIEKHFIWLGLTERFDESILMLSKILDWNWPHYIRENVSKVRKPTKEIEQKDIDTIKAFNSLDIKLYEYANKRMSAETRAIEGFHAELEAFKQKNDLIQKRWGWLPDRLKKFVV